MCSFGIPISGLLNDTRMWCLAFYFEVQSQGMAKLIFVAHLMFPWCCFSLPAAQHFHSLGSLQCNYRVRYYKLFITYDTRARFGPVAPLGRPRSVHKSDVEYCFVSRNSQMALKVKVNAYHFQYWLGESQDAYLVHIWCDSSPNISTVISRTSQIS